MEITYHYSLEIYELMHRTDGGLEWVLY